LRTLLLGGETAAVMPHNGVARVLTSSERLLKTDLQPFTRNSNGLDQFFASMRDLRGLSILDFAGASQANVGVITGLGHRIYSEDFLRGLDSCFGIDEVYGSQADPERTEGFFRQVFEFPPECFDGALVWDSLQYLTPPLLERAVDELARTLKPGASMLAFFHSNEKAESVPVYSYRMGDAKTLSLTPRGMRRPAQFFNNRALEKLFHKYKSIKFFLTRDSLREVLVRR
jgi:hypothetical protein